MLAQPLRAPWHPLLAWCLGAPSTSVEASGCQLCLGSLRGIFCGSGELLLEGSVGPSVWELLLCVMSAFLPNVLFAFKVSLETMHIILKSPLAPS